MRRRLWFLPIAAVVITGLCAYRATRPPRPVVAVEAQPLRAFPPKDWELPDHGFRLVKFNRFLGRHPVVVLFFDSRQPIEEDTLLIWLRDHADEIYDAGWRIIAISPAPPAEVRNAATRAGQDWPFPVLTDMHLRNPAPTPVHYLWSRIDRMTGEPLPALFLVDRMGYVVYQNGRPLPEQNPLQSLKQIIHP